MNKYFIALPTFKGSKGFCHQTILVKAKDINDAIKLIKFLKPNSNIGEIKQVHY